MSSLLEPQELLRAKDARLGALLNEIRALRRLTEEQKSEIERLRRGLAETEHRRHHAYLHVQALDTQIATILASTSWRYTAGLRAIMTFVRKLKHLGSSVHFYARRQGGGVRGYIRVAGKVAAALTNHGVGGALHRYRQVRSMSANASPRPSYRPPLRPIALPRQPVPPTRPEGKLLSVVVCVHNALEDVKRCLASVQLWTSAPYEIVIVDDGSQDPTREFLNEYASEQGAKLSRNDAARGYTFAANQGIAAARGDYIVLLNSDTIVSPLWSERLVAALESSPKVGAAGPMSNTASWQSIPALTEDGDWATNPLPEGWPVERFGQAWGAQSLQLHPDMPFLNGFCFALKRELLDDIGAFDEVNFGAGYGEENDYCLRATSAGWRLALADDAYVFHAQSKSYSHERRKKLADAAGQTLQRLHGAEAIERGVAYCRFDAVLEGIRARASAFFARQECLALGKLRHEGKRVLFFLPVLNAGGGANIVIIEARALRAMGVDACLMNYARCRDEFEASYPSLDVPVIYAEEDETAWRHALEFDAVVGTAHHTMPLLAPLEDTGVAVGYYVQDYEPLFYPEGSRDEADARASYHVMSRTVTLTKTAWNRDILERREKVTATVIGSDYDADLFVPRPASSPRWPDAPLRIVAMIRPSSPRRAPLETMEAFAELASRYGNAVSIEVFGASEDDMSFAGCTMDFAFVSHGVLNPLQLAGLLPECDIFVDFSTYQAMGLTAMEAMACGCAVIVPSDGGATAFARNDVNALVIDTTSAEARLNALTRLIEDHELRRRLQTQALADMPHHYPEGPALRMLDALFGASPAAA